MGALSQAQDRSPGSFGGRREVAQEVRRNYSLPFRLLADTDKTILKDYGVWGEKSLYGRKSMGIHRVTYLIDEKGKIAAVWPKVKPDGHAEELLAAAGA